MGNTIGSIFQLTTYGESHGVAVGGIVDGMPAGVPISVEEIQKELDRRRPGQSKIVTQRNEADRIEILSGVFDGRSTGTPIAFEVRNTDHHSQDYEEMKNLYRPSHADYTYQQKYGIRDYRGGGRSSARETISRVAGGALAKQLLSRYGIVIRAYTSQVGQISVDRDYHKLDLTKIEDNIVRCPDQAKAVEMIDLIDQVRREGDTIGGVITCVIENVPVGLGEPAFGKLHARLGSAILSINACKGFEYGMGFDGVCGRGSQMNDIFTNDSGRIHTKTNNSGGIQGGISNGEDIYFRAAFKPIPTLLSSQDTVSVDGESVVLKAKGRHDPCVLPRAVPIVEAMSALVLADCLLELRSSKID